MIKFVICLTLFVCLFSCSSSRDNETLRDIKRLEFSRVEDTLLFTQQMPSDDPFFQLMIIESMGRIGDSSFVPYLAKRLQSGNINIINKSIFALGQIGTNECEKILLNLYSNQKSSRSKKDIVEALGMCGKKRSAIALSNSINSLNDSLKVLAIKNLAFIYKRIDPIQVIPRKLIKYLHHESDFIRQSTIYFFRRNAFPESIHSIIKSTFAVNSLGNKYKLSAIFNILQKQGPDSESITLLKEQLIPVPDQTLLNWRENIYRIKLLKFIADSVSVHKISLSLTELNPHLRLASISTLGDIKSSYSKNILLKYYDRADWLEKGNIILALATRYPRFIYRLIQQNLDKGTPLFKELLLQSLTRIGDDFARIQLHQFLNVPSPRLQAIAFRGLVQLYDLTYKHVKPLLLSGDLVLTTLAADWISENRDYGVLSDLINAYHKFSEPQDIESMSAIINAVNSLKSNKSIPFLDSVYINTSSRIIAQKAASGLSEFGLGVPDKHYDTPDLFVPDSMIFGPHPVLATIQTAKGDIHLELWPDIAPLTVSNFVYLSQKGFYKNLTFHRVVSDFVIQGGDPRGDGWGGPGYSIPCEYNEKPFLRGSIGMATAGKDTGGSQFFICHSEQPHLNRCYTNFGIVTKGLNIVDNIVKDDKIINITITN